VLAVYHGPRIPSLWCPTLFRRSDNTNVPSKRAVRPARCLHVPTSPTGRWQKRRVELTGPLENSSKPSPAAAGSGTSRHISHLCLGVRLVAPLPMPGLSPATRCGVGRPSASSDVLEARTFVPPLAGRRYVEMALDDRADRISASPWRYQVTPSQWAHLGRRAQRPGSTRARAMEHREQGRCTSSSGRVPAGRNRLISRLPILRRDTASGRSWRSMAIPWQWDQLVRVVALPESIKTRPIGTHQEQDRSTSSCGPTACGAAGIYQGFEYVP
jgi:hypothetical protein